jgi:hypothetical protein
MDHAKCPSFEKAGWNFLIFVTWYIMYKNHWGMIYLYQGRENKMIEQNEVFVKWKQLVSNLQNNRWTQLHMRTWKNQLLLLLSLLLLVPKIGEMWSFDDNDMFDPLWHLLLWYLVLVWRTKQFVQFKLLNISLHNATITWCIGVLRLPILDKGFSNNVCATIKHE